MPKWLDDMTNAGEPVIPKLILDAVWERDDGECTKCGTKEEVEAYCIVPYGMPTETNTRLLCKACRRLL